MLVMPHRYGIIASPAERITAQKPPGGERNTTDESPFRERLYRILRTCRSKPAARRTFQRRHVFLVKAQEENKRTRKYRHDTMLPR